MSQTILKLKATNSTELAVISGLMQDALVHPREVTLTDNRFVLLTSRFMWENDETKPHNKGDADFASVDVNKGWSRVRSGLRFEGVLGVQSSHWPRNFDVALNLLSIVPDKRPEHFLLIFSGKTTVRLQVKSLFCILEDISEPWPSPHKPKHLAS